MKLLAAFALGVALAVAPIRAQGQDRTQMCQQVSANVEQVAVDRDSGMPRELALKHLSNTMAEQSGVPTDEALRKEGRDLSAKMVTLVYGDLSNLPPEVIKIESESACLNKGH